MDRGSGKLRLYLLKNMILLKYICNFVKIINIKINKKCINYDIPNLKYSYINMGNSNLYIFTVDIMVFRYFSFV